MTDTEKTTANPLLLHRCMLAALCCYLIVYFVVGERVPYNGGRGFDGYFYATLTQDLPHVLSQRIPIYQLGRIFPSACIWLGANILGISIASTDHIVSAFALYNSLWLVIAAVSWIRVSQKLRLSTEVATIGWTSLFINWTVLKQYFYFTVQTDTTAFALGVCVALCVVERRPFLLAFIALVASFTWKTVMPITFLLALFPQPVVTANTPRSRISTTLAVVGAVGAAAIAGTIVVWQYWVGASAGWQYRFQEGEAQTDLSMLPLSLLLLAGYVFYVLRSIPFARIFAIPDLRPYRGVIFFISIWVFGIFVFAALKKCCANGVYMRDVSSFIVYIFSSSVAKPGIFILAMVAAFGPAFLLLIWRLPEIMNAAASQSLGCLLFLLTSVFLTLNTESRQAVFSYPLLIAFLCAALQDTKIDRKFVLFFLLVSLLLSEIYLPLNMLGMDDISSTKIIGDVNSGVLQEFPWQLVFMNIGNYMGWTGYLIHAGSVAIIFAAFLYFRTQLSVDGEQT